MSKVSKRPAYTHSGRAHGIPKLSVKNRKKAGNEPETSDSRELRSDILAKVQEISDRENLPCWHYACVDPSIPVDRSMMPMDYSSSDCVNIYYDDSLITGCPRIKRTIGESAGSTAAGCP